LNLRSASWFSSSSALNVLRNAFPGIFVNVKSPRCSP
jgi:hypothetical protein